MGIVDIRGAASENLAATSESISWRLGMSLTSYFISVAYLSPPLLSQVNRLVVISRKNREENLSPLFGILLCYLVCRTLELRNLNTAFPEELETIVATV